MSSILRRAGSKLGRLIARAADPGVLAGQAQIYAKNVAGTTQLFGMDGAGVVAQLTPITAYRYRQVAVSGALTTSDEIVVVAGNIGAVTLTLPAAAALPAGQRFCVKDGDGTAAQYPVTIAPAGGDAIDGDAGGVTIAIPYGSLDLVADGVSAWRII